MKQWHWTVVLLVVFAGLGFYVLRFERGAVPEGPLVFKFDPEQCEKVELQPAQDEAGSATAEEKKLPVVLAKAGADWKIQKPFPARADQDKVKELLDRIKDLVIKDPISNDVEAGGLDLDEYGLKKPRASVTVHLKGKAPMALLFGNKSIDSASVYTMKKGDKGVFLIGTALYDDANKAVDDFRDKDALSLDKDLLMKVRLTRADTTLEIGKRNVHEKEKDETTATPPAKQEEPPKKEYEYDWWLTKPVEARADKYGCDGIVTKLDDLKVDKWVDNAPKDLAKYALDKPWLRADVWIGDAKRPRSLFIGRKADEDAEKLYAMNSLDKPVFLVNKSILDDLRKEAKDLRDKKVFGFEKDKVEKFSVVRKQGEVLCRRTARGDDEQWQMLKPQEVQADKKEIDNILWDLSGLNANEFVDVPQPDSAYGLDKPPFTVKVWAEGDKKERTLLVGTKAGTTDNIYVKIEGEETVYEVGKSLQENLEKIDTKKLRDRTVLKFKQDALSELELQFGKTHVVLERSGTDWKMTKPKQMDADGSTVSSLLWKFEDFHADEYVGPAPKDRKRYGFDKPQAEVTFHVRGKRPQTMLLGKTEAGKLYVMLKGGDSVFRHAESLLDDVRKNEQDFRKQPAPPGGMPGAPPY